MPELAPTTGRLVIQEHAQSTYPPRTYASARTANLTIALALDYSTAGEVLTHKAAGERYLPVSLDADPDVAATRILTRLQAMGRLAPIINIAGNGIYSLVREGWTQADVDRQVHAILSRVHAAYPLGRVISGGQTGVDWAGLVAAVALDIPATGLLPKGCRQRDAKGRETNSTPERIAAGIEAAAAGLVPPARQRCCPS